MANPPTSVRLAPEVVTAVRAYATSRGIAFSAAVSVLLTEALLSTGFHPTQQQSGDSPGPEEPGERLGPKRRP